jgi:hypothetical protein
VVEGIAGPNEAGRCAVRHIAIDRISCIGNLEAEWCGKVCLRQLQRLRWQTHQLEQLERPTEKDLKMSARKV